MPGTDEDKLQGMAKILVQEKLLTSKEAIDYQSKANTAKVSLQSFLIQKGKVSAQQIAWILAQNFGLPYFDLAVFDQAYLPEQWINEKLIKRHRVVPLFKRGKHLFIAIDDPTQQSSLKEIQFHSGLIPIPIVVDTDKLERLIEQLFSQTETNRLSHFYSEGTVDELDNLEITSADDDDTDNQIQGGEEDAPVVKFINRIIVDAIKKGASDIHFEPYEHEYRIRYRQDGILNEVAKPPAILSSRIAARIKVMSNLDISERRIPQDGRFKMRLSKTNAIDFRVSTCPTIAGEKIVMRILDPGSTRLGIDALGFNPNQKEQFMHAIHKPQGMILVTGPTGSGKTVTLYTALNLLNTCELNISTAEDPVEIKVPGINQVNINLKAGLTFSSALRAFLRQDPDIIMVGEIRDLETAEISIKAAQTGHLVLSTLHTNSAAESLTRLVNMGIPAYNIASSVSLIIAQRLARRLCEHCKAPNHEVNLKIFSEQGFSDEALEHAQIFKSVGCPQCTLGYRGRVGLYEVLPMTKTIGELIMTGGNSLDISKLAQSEGMLTIYQTGLHKVLDGTTSLEEIHRVTVD